MTSTEPSYEKRVDLDFEGDTLYDVLNEVADYIETADLEPDIDDFYIVRGKNRRKARVVLTVVESVPEPA